MFGTVKSTFGFNRHWSAQHTAVNSNYTYASEVHLYVWKILDPNGSKSILYIGRTLV